MGSNEEWKINKKRQEREGEKKKGKILKEMK